MNKEELKVLELIYKVHMTLLEMLIDRGYELYDEDEDYYGNFFSDEQGELMRIINETKDKQSLFSEIKNIKAEIRQRKLENKQLFIERVTDEAIKKEQSVRQVLTKIYENEYGDHILVYYIDSHKSIGIDALSGMINYMEEKNVTHAIAIIPRKMTSDAGKKIQGLPALTIEVFLESELVYNPTKHILVPKHYALSGEQFDKFYQQNKSELDKYPMLQTQDIISRYYGFKNGTIVGIHNINFLESIIKKYLSIKLVQNPTLKKPIVDLSLIHI